MAKIKLYEFTDPACTWCWGSEPILRRLETHYGDQLDISYIMGGLVEDAYNFYDSQNNIGGDLKTMNEQVAKHWLEASSRHGMPVMVDNYNLMTPEHHSTYPMNIAYKAAEMMNEPLAKKYLRRIREAAATEGLQANDPAVLIDLAAEMGFIKEEFSKLFLDGPATKAFYKDKNLTMSKRVNGFPSYLIVNEQGDEIILRGYQQYDNFVRMIARASSNKINPTKPANDLNAVKEFISTYKKVAPIEISSGLNLSIEVLDGYIDELIVSGDVEIQNRGNGYFILLKDSEGQLCDAETGICTV